MAAGGFCKLPNGTVVVALNLPTPTSPGTDPDAASVRILVHAVNRARALTRLRNLGMRAVYLRGNAAPPTPDEITAVLHHPDGLIWRTTPDSDVMAPPDVGGPRVRSAAAGWVWLVAQFPAPLRPCRSPRP